jgi:hypothetical protein
MNNRYPVISIPLASNNRAIDICPHQYVTLTLSAEDTERGIVWDVQKLIPRNVSFSHDSGRLITDLSCEYLVSIPTKSYEVTCPSEPDNEPDQPQDPLPEEPPWPDIAGGEVLTRNSFLSGLHYSICDQEGIKSIIGMSSNPNMKKLATFTINSNIVSSNVYAYFLNTSGDDTAHRVPIKSQGTSASHSLGANVSQSHITLVEENKIAYLVIDGDNYSLRLLNFSNGQITELTNEIPYQVDEGGGDYTYYSQAWIGGIYTIKGVSDGKLYLISPFTKWFVPNVGSNEVNYIVFYIYNYTDGILHDPIELQVDPSGTFSDENDVQEYNPPTIVGSEIVWSFNTDADNDVESVPFYCINVETQTGQVAFWSDAAYSSYYPYRVVSDRLYRNVYCLISASAIGGFGDDDFPILKYNLATNTVTVESYNPQKDTAGGGYAGNLGWLMQDKNYTYKVVNLYCSDTSGNPNYDKSNCSSEELNPRIDRLISGGNQTLIFRPPARDYWGVGDYEIDDVTGDFYTNLNNGKIWENNGTRIINVDTVYADLGGIDALLMQGDHLFLEDSNYVWVVY